MNSSKWPSNALTATSKGNFPSLERPGFDTNGLMWVILVQKDANKKYSIVYDLSIESTTAKAKDSDSENCSSLVVGRQAFSLEISSDLTKTEFWSTAKCLTVEIPLPADTSTNKTGWFHWNHWVIIYQPYTNDLKIALHSDPPVPPATTPGGVKTLTNTPWSVCAWSSRYWEPKKHL